VRHCIDILAAELRMTMALCGARNIAELDRDLIRRRPAVGLSA
jgi:isopentenyl diphosphate isomerase/L-lactate dehydrogenase-like FMN-dependent dehydrogenase